MKEKDSNFSKLFHVIIDDGTLSKLKGTEAKVYMVLLRHAGYENRKCWPSIETIAREAGVSKKRVSPATKRLQELGLIKKWLSPGEFGKRRNTYFLPKIHKGNEKGHTTESLLGNQKGDTHSVPQNVTFKGNQNDPLNRDSSKEKQQQEPVVDVNSNRKENDTEIIIWGMGRIERNFNSYFKRTVGRDHYFPKRGNRSLPYLVHKFGEKKVMEMIAKIDDSLASAKHPESFFIKALEGGWQFPEKEKFSKEDKEILWRVKLLEFGEETKEKMLRMIEENDENGVKELIHRIKVHEAEQEEGRLKRMLDKNL